MLSKNTVTEQQVNNYVSTAFTMALSAETLEQYLYENMGCNSSVYKQIVGQLKWLSSQQKNIITYLLDDSNLSRYELLLNSLSNQMESQLEDLELSFTEAVFSRQNLNNMGLIGKSHALKLTIQSFYDALLSIRKTAKN